MGAMGSIGSIGAIDAIGVRGERSLCKQYLMACLFVLEPIFC